MLSCAREKSPRKSRLGRDSRGRPVGLRSCVRGAARTSSKKKCAEEEAILQEEALCHFSMQTGFCVDATTVLQTLPTHKPAKSFAWQGRGWPFRMTPTHHPAPKRTPTALWRLQAPQNRIMKKLAYNTRMPHVLSNPGVWHRGVKKALGAPSLLDWKNHGGFSPFKNWQKV